MASTILDCWLGASAPSIFATSWFDLALSGSNAARPRLLSDSRLRRASCCEDSTRNHPRFLNARRFWLRIPGTTPRSFVHSAAVGLSLLAGLYGTQASAIVKTRLSV